MRNHIHGLSPSPGAYGEIDCGGRTERIKILRAAVVDLSGPPGAVLDAEMTVACGVGAHPRRRSPARRQVRNVRRGTDARRKNCRSARDSFPQRVLHPRAELAFQFVLGPFRRAQDLADAQKIEHGELLDGGPHQDVGRAHL